MDPQSTGNRSLVTSLQNIGETLAISWPTLVDAALGRLTKEACDERLARWAKRLVAHAQIDLHVHGREHLANRTFLVMSNHQSLYDIPVLFVTLGSNLRMITKKELFRVPIFGRALDLGGFISIDRGDRNQAVQSLSTAKDVLNEGTHVWIAPEGTRSKTGGLLPFKKGGFTLAMAENLPILPISLVGTKDTLPAKAFRTVVRARVDVVIHPPIEPSQFAGLDAKAGRDALSVAVRKAIESGFEHPRGVPERREASGSNRESKHAQNGGGSGRNGTHTQ